MTGTTISHYQIEQELGRGGMGVVYKARDTRLNRTVAIKVLPAHALASEEDRARFYREAQAAAALSHANIATVYEIDESAVIPAKAGISPGQAVVEGEPQPFIAMEFVEGESLADRIVKGPLPLKQAIAIASQIAEGLHAAHAKDIVHRDIKSGNVMLTADGQAKILDFGLAKTAASTKLTNLGSTLGTIAYMSPEQARGEEVDRRTDIWSLGVVLYEMVAGRHPFPGDYEQAVVYEILNAEPEPLTSVRTGVPMALEWIIGKMLAKAAKARYQSTAEILVDLAAVNLRSPSGFSRVSTAAAIPSTGVRRSKTISLQLAAAMLIVVATASFLAAIFLQPETERPGVYRASVMVPQEHLWQPLLSPNGRYLAYSGRSRNEELGSLFIYDFVAAHVESVPNSERIAWKSFAPDSRSIAFTARGNLYTVPVTGGEPLYWTDDAAYAPSWGLEGELYFQRRGNIMRIDGPRERPILFLSPDSTLGQEKLFPVQVLPESKKLLVIDERASSGSDALFLASLETKDSELVMPEDAYAASYATSGHLVYMTKDFDQILARVFDPVKNDFSGSGRSVHPAVYAVNWTFSDNGNFVSVVQPETIEMGLYTLDSDGIKRPITPEVKQYFGVRSHPNRPQFALKINVGREEESLIEILDLETSTSRTLVPADGRWNWGPSWSPDGTRIVFSSNRDSRYAGDLYVQNVDGSGSPKRIWQSDSRSQHPDWSPDGQHIVFRSNERGHWDLWMYSFTEEDARPLGNQVNNSETQSRPRFSPNGRFIAYVSTETGTYEIFVATLDGASKWQVTREGGQLPVWSRDGTRLYYWWDNAINAVNVEFDPTFTFVSEAKPVYSSETLEAFDALENRDEFVIAEAKQITRAYFEVIFNWFEELETLAPHSK